MLSYDGAAGAILGHERDRSRVYGVVPAVVTQIHDPDQQRHRMGMVRVYFPWLQSQGDPNLINPWARVLSSAAGGGAGFYAFPKLGDEVLVAFEHGDMANPYVLGALWNGLHHIPEPTTPNDKVEMKGHHGGPTLSTPDLKPLSLSGDEKKNQVEYWRSRTGHLIALDDEQGTVRICDRTGTSVIQLEQDCLKILKRKGDIRIFAGKLVRVDCEKFEVHASDTIKIQAGNDFTVHAGKNVTMEAGGSIGATAQASTGKGIVVTSQKAIVVNAGTNATITANLGLTAASATQNVTVQAGGKLDMYAKQPMGLTTDAKLELKGSAGARIEAGGNITVKAGGDLNCEGNEVNIN